MINFQYSGFWDVPLGVVLTYWGKAFVLMRHFDEERDEYDDHYSVYLLTEPIATLTGKTNAPGDFWKNLNEEHLTCIGQVPVSSIKFDPSKRKQLDPSILDKFVDKVATKNI